MPLSITAKPALFLLPGLLCDATVWAPQVTGLSDIADIHTPDFLGQSDITAMAQTVLATASERFAVVGHSMGARVALEIARIAPERVARIALLDTGVAPQAPGEAAKRQVLVDLAQAEGMAALAARWLPPMVHSDRLADTIFMAGLHAMVERATPAIYAGQVQALLNRPDAEPALRGLRCPVLIGVGRQDAWSPPSQHEAMAMALPHARYVVFENSGHMSPLEAPVAVTAALRAWLTAPAG